MIATNPVFVDPVGTRNPYQGLRPFQPSDWPFFCGRKTHVAEVLQRLQSNQFVAIVGLSGSGKSSLVRAGVIPELRADRLKNTSSDWLIVLTTPGTAPLNNLGQEFCRAIQKYFEENEKEGQKDLRPADEVEAWVEGVNEVLNFGTLGLARAIDTAGLPKRVRILVVVDQFEELFRYTRRNKRDEAERFVEQLLRVTSGADRNVYVIITMRSEFMGDCARFEGLAEAVNAGLYLTPRLSRDQLREAIMVPAEKCGREIAPSLVLRLLNDVANDQDQLPVLQHALMRCWEKTSGTIDETQYIAIGGAHALDDHAEELFRELTKLSDDPDQTRGKRNSQIVRALFKRITKPANQEGISEDEPDGRRDPATLDMICSQSGFDSEEVIRIIDRYRRRDCAFLLPSLELEKILNGKSMIDITHESLIRKWHWLGRWVREEAKSASAYKQLAEDATEASESEVLSERKVNIVLEESVRWNANWADRYGGRYEQTISYLRKSQRVLQTKQLEEKEKEEQRIEAKLKQKQLQRVRLLKKFASWLVLTALILAFSAWVFLPPLLKNFRVLTAEALARQAEEQARQYGASTQERAALLDIQSLRTEATPSNTNVATWEGFERITRGMPINAVVQSTLQGQVHDLVITKDGTIDSSRVLVVSERQTDDTRQLLALAIDGNALRSSPDFLPASTETKVTAISSLGRYASTPCEKGRSNIYALGKLEPFPIACEETIRLIVDSLDSRRFVTVESKAPPAEESSSTRPDPPLSTIRVWEAGGKSVCRNALPLAVMKVLISPDGNFVATIERPTKAGGQRLEIRSLDASCAPVSIPGPLVSVSEFAAMEFSHDNKFLAVGGQQGQLFLMRYQEGSGWINASYASASELRQPTVSDAHNQGSQAGNLPRQHPQAVRFFLQLHGNSPITAVAFGNQSNLLATAGADHIVRVSDPEAIPQFNGIAKILWSDDFAAAASELTFSRQDRFLGMALGESTARIKYARTGVETARVTHRSRVSSIIFSFDEGTALSASDGKKGEVFSFPTVKQELPISVKLEDCPVPQQAAQSEDGSILATSCSILNQDVFPLYKAVAARVFKFDGSARSTNASNSFLLAEAEKPTPSGPPMCQVAVSANGGFAAAECDGQITLFDLKAEKPILQKAILPGLASVDDASSPGAQKCHAVWIALNREGTMLGVGDDCGVVRIFGTTSSGGLQLIRSYEIKTNSDSVAAITSIAFSQRSTMIAAGNSDGILWLESLGQTKHVPHTEKYESSISALQFSSSINDRDDSPSVIFGSGTMARIMRTSDHRILSEFTPGGNVRAVAFSKDGERAGAGAINGAVSVVDLSDLAWSNKIRFSLYKVFEPWTHYDPSIVRAPALWLSAVPGWVSPPSVRYDGEQKIYTLRFVGRDKLELGADSVGVMESFDRGSSFWFLSLTKRDLKVFDDLHLGGLCGNLRENLSGAGGTKYQDICTDELLSKATLHAESSH